MRFVEVENIAIFDTDKWNRTIKAVNLKTVY
jgi:hypothetical protein